MEATVESKNFNSQIAPADFSEGFPILWDFPREFKRNWLKQFDLRFITILIFTFIFEVGLVVYLSNWVTNRSKNVDVNSIQKQYAHLLLNRFNDTKFSFEAEKPSGTYLYSPPEAIEPAALSGSQDASLPGSGASSSAGYSSGASAGRTFGNDGSHTFPAQSIPASPAESYASATRRAVGNIGLLSYLDDDNINLARDELKEVFSGIGSSQGDLEGSLANIKLTDFKSGSSGRAGGGGENRSGTRRLKGSKSTVSRSELHSSLVPLEKADYSTIAKNTELEAVSGSALQKTGKKATARKAEQVMRVVLGHNRAIQDCYKQALKKRPDLKGKVVVRFSVAPDGSVDRVALIRTTIDYEPMIKCIVNRIRRWNDFGESDPAIGTVSYRQTYVFGY